MKVFVINVLLLITLISCNSTVDESIDDHFSVVNTGKKELSLSRLNLDTIYLDKIESSYTGFISIANEDICFIDNRFCWNFKFDTLGNLKSRDLGQGRGPHEIPTGFIDGYLHLSDQRDFYFGSSWDCYVFNQKSERIKEYRIDWKIENTKDEMLKSPNANMHGLYTIAYHKLELRDYNGFVYFPILSQHPTFNFIISKDYYATSYILAKMRIDDGKVDGLYGRRSPVFSKYNFIGQFSLMSFDISKEGKIFVTHEPDSSIYVYNDDFKIIDCFGFSGLNMDQDYLEISDLQTFKAKYSSERKSKGYYSKIEYIDERKLLFRSYSKGEHSLHDGLQIYKNNVLIADVEVPKGFYVTGYLSPHFISNAEIDDVVEEIKIYKFKLPF